MRITPQRRLIVERLAGDPGHPDAEAVYRQVRRTMPEVSLATVYNTLRALVEIGELVPVEDAGGTRYDTNSGSHHHLRCVACHRLVDVVRDFAGLNLPAAEAAGYRILSHQVTFYGVCPECSRVPQGDGPTRTSQGGRLKS